MAHPVGHEAPTCGVSLLAKSNRLPVIVVWQPIQPTGEKIRPGWLMAALFGRIECNDAGHDAHVNCYP
jgi:hypothetical protein